MKIRNKTNNALANRVAKTFEKKSPNFSNSNPKSIKPQRTKNLHQKYI
jgi:hypothetical protein